MSVFDSVAAALNGTPAAEWTGVRIGRYFKLGELRVDGLSVGQSFRLRRFRWTGDYLRNGVALLLVAEVLRRRAGVPLRITSWARTDGYFEELKRKGYKPARNSWHNLSRGAQAIDLDGFPDGGQHEAAAWLKSMGWPGEALAYPNKRDSKRHHLHLALSD